MAKFATKFSFGHYEAIAKIIREIPDVQQRRVICKIIGEGFNKRSNVFDYYLFSKRCDAYIPVGEKQ